MIDQPQDPLAASLRLQLEGDIRLQEGDYELVYEDQWAVVRPVQTRSKATFVLGPLFAACVLTLFWLTLFVVPSVAARWIIGAVLLLMTTLCVLGFVGMHRAFITHRSLPPLLRVSAHQVELPQARASLPIESILALFIIRVPLMTKVGDEAPNFSGSFDQAGLIHRNDDGGVSSLVLASTEHWSLCGLWAALEELAKVHSIRFIEQEWPFREAIDRFRLQQVIRGRGRRLLRRRG
jgi:hypothetical protein